MVRIFSQPGLHKAKSHSAKAYTEATLFPILELDKLLPEVEKNYYFSKLQEEVTLPDDYFSAVYADLIEKYALFVQTLPERYGEELGGLLNEGLRRGLLAVQILHNTHVEKPHPLFIFAVYSIALLADIGSVLNYRITISDDKGVTIDDWYPHLGLMNEFGNHFKLRPYEGTPTSLIRNSTPLLARQLLSDTAVTWLTSNNQIFDMWLAFLNKGEDWVGGLAKILRIDPKTFENIRNESGLCPVDIKIHDPMGTELGEKFLAWLKSGLEDGTISYNEEDSKVHVVKINEFDLSVFLQAPELFQQFTNIYLKSRDWVVTCKQFNALGLTKLSGGDYKFEQFFSESPDKSGKMGFLSKDKGSDQKYSAAQQSVLTSQAITTANNIKKGIVVRDVRMLFGAKVPGVSPFLRGIEMLWGLGNVLPKIRNAAAPGVGPNPNLGLK